MTERDAVALALLGASYLFFRSTSRSTTGRILFGGAVAIVLQLLILYHLVDRFTGDGINEAALFHVRYGFSGAGYGEYVAPLAAAAAISVGSLAASVWLVRRLPPVEVGRWRSRAFLGGALGVALGAAVGSPAASDLYALGLRVAPTRGAPDLAAYEGFYAHYREPRLRRLPGSPAPKNLVVIYAESLERSYLDERVFPGLTPRLRELQGRSASFTDIRQVEGTSFTMAGLTASLCGLPLFTPSHGNAMSGADEFMSSATAFTDLLQEEGYYLSYMGGARSGFAGKGKLLRSHGFAEVLGLEDLARAAGDAYHRSAWGLYDDVLLDLVYERFLELSAEPHPFGLFTLTLDTHHPSGHIPEDEQGRYRYGDGSNAMLNAVARADHLIAELVRRIAASEHAERTIVVVLSDHLAMPNDAADELARVERRNLLMVFDPANPRGLECSVTGSTLDLGPTILPFLGYRGQVGLGRDLLHADVRVRAEVQRIHERLPEWREPVLDFWDFPRVQDALHLDPVTECVSIDGRTFRLPVLIELTEDLRTTLRFDFDRDAGRRSLTELAKAQPAGTRSVLIDRLSNIGGGLSGDGYGVVLMTGATIHGILPLERACAIPAAELQRVFGLPRRFEALPVAHAGGGIDGQTYTNSYEALDHALASGFRYFELDFSFTSDGHLVCIHDWEGNFRKVFQLPPRGPVSLEEFEELVRTRAKYTNCTLAGLAEWMARNPAAVIVTDVKERNPDALRLIAAALPDSRRRVIPQIYRPESYGAVKALGFEQVIWTLYRYGGGADSVLEWVDRFEGPVAVTMPRGRARSALPRLLGRMGVPTYVHTINDPEERAAYRRRGITEVYTDFLSPVAR